MVGPAERGVSLALVPGDRCRKSLQKITAFHQNSHNDWTGTVLPHACAHELQVVLIEAIITPGSLTPFMMPQSA